MHSIATWLVQPCEHIKSLVHHIQLISTCLMRQTITSNSWLPCLPTVHPVINYLKSLHSHPALSCITLLNTTFLQPSNMVFWTEICLGCFSIKSRWEIQWEFSCTLQSNQISHVFAQKCDWFMHKPYIIQEMHFMPHPQQISHSVLPSMNGSDGFNFPATIVQESPQQFYTADYSFSSL